jgi:hypothetical protein
MPGRSENVTAQKRSEIAAQLQAAIVAESDPQRKAALGSAIGQLQSNLNGMTNEEVAQAVVAFILDNSQPQ